MISCKKLYRESGAQVMGLCTFKGGVHPYDGKDLSKDKPIQEYLPGLSVITAHWCTGKASGCSR